MKIYARIVDGAVFEIINPMSDENGEEIPIEQRFTPEFVASLVDITGVSPFPAQGWSAKNAGGVWTFASVT